MSSATASTRLAHAVEVLVVGHGDVDGGQHPPLGLVGHAQDLPVAHVPDDPGQVAQSGDPQRDVLDHADGFAEVHQVADPVLVLEDQEDARQVVLDQALRPEAEGHTQYAGAGQQGRDVDAQDRQDQQQRDDEHRRGDHRPQQGADRLRALLAALAHQHLAEFLGPLRPTGLAESFPAALGGHAFDDPVEDRHRDPSDGDGQQRR